MLMLFFGMLGAASVCPADQAKTELAPAILADGRLDRVEKMALELLTGFNAGTSYGEIWIRDFNTFIDGSLRVHSPAEVKERLLLFFKFQGEDGNIPDGAITTNRATVGYNYIYSALAPGWAAHKNTVETDQESSLVQAVSKYVAATGDRAFLMEKVGGESVYGRLERALLFVMHQRWSDKYGLVTGATTIDWGDVQAESGWGVTINDKTKWAIDIYDNAMFLIAVKNFIGMAPPSYHAAMNWKVVARDLQKHIRRYLWDPRQKKYRPHLYLGGSPFPASFPEDNILYTGGTTCAILAGLNSKTEIAEINRKFVAAAEAEPHATIGITVRPPYPLEEFPNMAPYTYQNGGDWAWFGARMVQALVENGFPREAYGELSPMLDRVIRDNDFYEWYDVKTGQGKGSGHFRGAAGALFNAIESLRGWARAAAGAP